jgi:AbrB family looped-hinge helix DNA binding protein
MSTVTISSKGWIVIPAEYRKKYDMKSGDRVRLVDHGGVLTIVPVLKDPVKQARGIMKGKTSLTKALLEERGRERRREDR